MTLEELVKRIIDDIALRRGMKPEEVAEIIYEFSSHMRDETVGIVTICQN